jgi:putative transcriptional regulator
MAFEWDDDKAAENLAVHGVRFEYAVRVFEDLYRVEIADDRIDYGESRYKTIGIVENRVLVVSIPFETATSGSFPHVEQNDMSEGNITTFDLDPTNPPTLSAAERARLDAMSEEDIHAAALADPDNPPLTEDELQRMERVPNAKRIRKQLGLTQKAFAETFQLSLSVVRDWEQGRFVPDRAARTLLKVLAYDPDAVKKALAHWPSCASMPPSPATDDRT